MKLRDRIRLAWWYAGGGWRSLLLVLWELSGYYVYNPWDPKSRWYWLRAR